MNGQDDSLGGGSPRMLDKIKNAGFWNANNRLILDVADAACWDNTGTELFNDLSFVGGYHFSNGFDPAADAGDMTFAGTPGSLDKNSYMYSSASGVGQASGQRYCEPDGTDPTFISSLHRNNGKGSLAGWFWMQNGGDTMTFFATSEIFWTNDQGFALAASGGANLGFWNRTGGSQGQILGGADVLPGQWTFIAMGLDEAATQLYVQVDATQTLKTDYTSADTTGPDGKMHIGTNSLAHWSNGLNWRWNCAFAWDDYMTPTEMLAVYNATKDRFL